ncbi:flavin reductase family protein [Streptomyces cinereospinus]|uniref:Flavin reductase family protein n=1 Tax=Streptomyces cinereospinus TaxID=285561 RepID=A0ABV5MXP9_9ACTN
MLINQAEGSSEVLPEVFRDFFQGLPAAATVVTATWDGRPHATTVSSFSSLSLDPPLVLIALGVDSRLLGVVRRSNRFAVHLLTADQQHIAAACAARTEDKLAGIAWQETDGLPQIDGAAGWMACDVDRVVAAGDHDLVVGRPRTVQTSAGTDPLLYYRRRFHRLARPAA